MLCGILFVLYTGIRWEFLPQELGFGSGMTCWRRLRDWNEAGVWQHLHELLLCELRAADLLDFSRAAVDSSHIRAMKGGLATGPSPVDRGKAGSKHHLIVEAHGIPLAAITTGGNRNDVTQLVPLIQAVPPIRGKRGQPLRRPNTCMPTAAMTTRSTGTRSAGSGDLAVASDQVGGQDAVRHEPLVFVVKFRRQRDDAPAGLARPGRQRRVVQLPDGGACRGPCRRRRGRWLAEAAECRPRVMEQGCCHHRCAATRGSSSSVPVVAM